SLLIPLLASAAGIKVIIDGKAIVFTDVQSNTWFAPYVREAAEAGIVTGYKDKFGKLTGKFMPSNDITIAEALKIAVEGAGYDEELYGSIVESGMLNHWASKYFSVAKGEEFDFLKLRARSDRAATRAEVASMFASAFRSDLSTATTVDTRYTDVSTMTMFASSIEALSRDDILTGDTDIHGQATGTFRPAANINRAEVAKMVIAARAKYGEPGKDRHPTESEVSIVTYSAEGFEPALLRVKSGTSVTFRNMSSGELWVASNPHPTHTGLSGFDAKSGIGQGESFMFRFTRLGTFGYHNHLDPSRSATIIVE
ncbi:MAG: hypothetical protein HOO67_04830, partial [Candidatus Peribacteraceae bacterium]|nr:hypothetical protein [Candidatus Peribacteraceae bacterium]